MTDTAAEPSRVTKREFISSVADRSGMTKGAVKTVYEALVEEITDTAKRDDILVTRSFTGQLCRGDIVRTVDRFNGFPSGACTFGEFIPYSRKKG